MIVGDDSWLILDYIFMMVVGDDWYWFTMFFMANEGYWWIRICHILWLIKDLVVIDSEEIGQIMPSMIKNTFKAIAIHMLDSTTQPLLSTMATSPELQENQPLPQIFNKIRPSVGEKRSKLGIRRAFHVEEQAQLKDDPGPSSGWVIDDSRARGHRPWHLGDVTLTQHTT